MDVDNYWQGRVNYQEFDRASAPANARVMERFRIACRWISREANAPDWRCWKAAKPGSRFCGAPLHAKSGITEPAMDFIA